MARLGSGGRRRRGPIGVASALLLGVAVASASSCSSSVTEVVVVVDGDLSRADAVAIKVTGTSGVVVDKTVRLDTVSFPLTLGVRAGEDESARFVVRAEALHAGVAIVSRTVRTQLVPGESRVLVVSLCQACDGVACTETTTCENGSCVELASELDLSAWNGTAPPSRCAPAPDVGGLPDAGVDAAPPAVLPGGYHEDLGDTRLWSSVDVGAQVDPSLRGYVGGAFDGRFLYLAPSVNAGTTHGNVARYDTTLPFEEKESWSKFDVSTVNANAKGYAGAAVFAKKYLYLVPYENPVGAKHGVVARYATGQPFDSPSSWSFFALGSDSATAGAGGHGGAVINASHIWLPSRDPSRVFALQDLRKSPLIDAEWQTYDTSANLDAGTGQPAAGYYGGAFAGDKLYFAPSRSGVAIRHSLGGLDQGWEQFDLATISPAYVGFVGIVSDGNRYVYFVPYESPSGTRHGNVLRFDTLGAFTARASWATVDLTTFDPRLKGFIGGVFDGRFVYFVPFDSTSSVVVVRYDTLGELEKESSWKWFDARTLPGGASRFNGGAFDGKYVYFIPHADGPVVRFEARTSPDPSVTAANGSFL